MMQQSQGLLHFPLVHIFSHCTGLSQVVPGATWWWISWAAISFLALLLNILFLAIVIKNRKTRDFRSLLTACLVTISVLDILDITRIVPSIITNLHIYQEFRIVYCSVGIFHHIAVALLLILIGRIICLYVRAVSTLFLPNCTQT